MPRRQIAEWRGQWPVSARYYVDCRPTISNDASWFCTRGNGDVTGAIRFRRLSDRPIQSTARDGSVLPVSSVLQVHVAVRDGFWPLAQLHGDVRNAPAAADQGERDIDVLVEVERVLC
jgi:hypothetical protein